MAPVLLTGCCKSHGMWLPSACSSLSSFILTTIYSVVAQLPICCCQQLFISGHVMATRSDHRLRSPLTRFVGSHCSLMLMFMLYVIKAGFAGWSLLGLRMSKSKSNDALHAISDEDVWWCQLEAKVTLNLHVHRRMISPGCKDDVEPS